MIQVEEKIEGQLAPCKGCGRQPRHYLVRGRGQHLLECAPCGTRTAKLPTFQQAVEAWEADERVAVMAGRGVA